MPAGSPIVVGYARTREGAAVLQVAVEESLAHQYPLILLHSSRGGVNERGEDVVADREALEQAEVELQAKGCEVEVLQLVLGHAPEEDIVRVATERQAALIVIGLRRRSPTGKAIFGSTSQQVMLHAPCPVLAVPRDQD